MAQNNYKTAEYFIIGIIVIVIIVYLYQEYEANQTSQSTNTTVSSSTSNSIPASNGYGYIAPTAMSFSIPQTTGTTASLNTFLKDLTLSQIQTNNQIASSEISANNQLTASSNQYAQIPNNYANTPSSSFMPATNSAYTANSNQAFVNVNATPLQSYTNQVKYYAPTIPTISQNEIYQFETNLNKAAKQTNISNQYMSSSITASMGQAAQGGYGSVG